MLSDNAPIVIMIIFNESSIFGELTTLDDQNHVMWRFPFCHRGTPFVLIHLKKGGIFPWKSTIQRQRGVASSVGFESCASCLGTSWQRRFDGGFWQAKTGLNFHEVIKERTTEWVFQKGIYMTLYDQQDKLRDMFGVIHVCYITILDHLRVSGGFLSHGGSPVVTMLVLILKSTDWDDLSGTPPHFRNLQITRITRHHYFSQMALNG